MTHGTRWRLHYGEPPHKHFPRPAAYLTAHSFARHPERSATRQSIQTGQVSLESAKSKLFAVERSERQKVELQGVAAATKRSTKDFDIPFQRECYFHLVGYSAPFRRSHCASPVGFACGFAPFHAYRVLLRKTSTPHAEAMRSSFPFRVLACSAQDDARGAMAIALRRATAQTLSVLS